MGPSNKKTLARNPRLFVEHLPPYCALGQTDVTGIFPPVVWLLLDRECFTQDTLVSAEEANGTLAGARSDVPLSEPNDE